MRRFLIIAPVIALASVILGCAAGNMRAGEEALKAERYQQALAYFESEHTKRPNDLAVLSALGRVNYHLQSFDQSEQYLSAVVKVTPDDPLANLYLGMLAESKRDWDAAVRRYQLFLAKEGKSKIAPSARGRLLRAQSERLKEQVETAAKNEAALSKQQPAPNSIGVLPFTVGTQADETLRSLAHGMAAATWYDLSAVKELNVVERLQIRYLMQELELSEQGLVAKESGPRLGQIVQAKHLVNANLDKPTKDRLAALSGLVNTTEKSYQAGLSADEDLSKVMRLQKEITVATLDSLGITLSGSKRREMKKAATDNFGAFLAFSRGIEQFDQGQHEKAKTFFDEALRLDPQFALAKQVRDQNNELILGASNLSDFEQSLLAELGTYTPGQENPIYDVAPTILDQYDPRNQDLPASGGGATGTATVTGTIR